MTENEIATIIVDSAFRVHTVLGPGLLDTVYQAALGYELKKRGLNVAFERPRGVRGGKTGTGLSGRHYR